MSYEDNGLCSSKNGKVVGSKQVTSMDVVPEMLGFEDKTN